MENFESLYVPNAFTPNNDSRNDVLMISGSPLPDFHLRIFNRWGQLVFFSDNQHTGWDGLDLKTGRMSMKGIYAYTLFYKDGAGIKHVRNGTIMLIR